MTTFDNYLRSFVLDANEDNFAIPATMPDGSATPQDADIRGNARANILTGDDSYNWLFGGLGRDVLIGGGGDDRYYLDVDADDQVVEAAGEGYDEVYASFSHRLGANVEFLFFLGSRDIDGFGNAEDNAIYGNTGANLLDGDLGADYLEGGTGDDTLVGGAGADGLNGGDGNDAVSYATSSAAVVIDLKKGTASGGDAAGDIFYDIENVIGSAFADKLTGNDDNNLLQGGSGDDTLDGGGNWDLLDGGAGDDRIFGKAGNDMLTGGIGQDQFWFDTILYKTPNVDTITDFNAADDTIYLSRSIFKKISKKGVLKQSAFKMGTKAGDADDRIIYDKNKGALYYDSDGKGGASAVQFATVTKKTALSANDFFVV